MTDRPRCLARIPKEGEWFKFKDADGREVRKRCFKEFRCDFLAVRDGLCERHWQKEFEFKKCGGGRGGCGKYDARHPMKNWVGRIKESWPEQHAPFWDSPEYHICVKNGLRLDREEIDICRKARNAAEGVAESVAEDAKKPLKTADVVKQDMVKPRPKRGVAVAAAATAAAIAATTAAAAAADSPKAVPNVLCTEEPVLFRDNRTPFKVNAVQKITRAQLREHVLAFLEENPEMKSLFS